MIGEFRLPKLNIGRLYNPNQTADTLSNAPENIDENCAAINNAFPWDVMEVFSHVPNSRHKIWLNAESWKQKVERKRFNEHAKTTIPSEIPAK